MKVSRVEKLHQKVAQNLNSRERESGAQGPVCSLLYKTGVIRGTLEPGRLN